MFNPGYYDADDPAAMYNLLRAGGGMPSSRRAARFDTYYRCYPTIMLPGSEREYLNYGGKIILPPSALDKLTRLHITYPMLFELSNGPAQRVTHAGVLEFVAEEGKVYLPNWMMQTLLLETGDMVQIKSTDLPQASFIKVQPQSTDFLDISDPKAVLENAFRGFSTLTRGDIFSFSYNDTIYDVAVLEVKPENDKHGVSVLETDVEVDFAAPLGYVEPSRTPASGASTPGRAIKGGIPHGGLLHNQRTMAQSINYEAIKPSATAAASGARAVSTHFLSGGNSLKPKKTKVPTPVATTPVQDISSNPPQPVIGTRRMNGPQPLRLPPNQLFFGYDIVPVKTKEQKEKEAHEAMRQPKFAGQGQTLRGGVKRKNEDQEMTDVVETVKPEPAIGRRLDGKKV